MKKGKDYIGVTVGVLCFHPDGRFLMVHRTEKCRDEHNRWDIIGGGLDFGEDFVAAAKREAHEEMGVQLADVQLVGARNVLREQEGAQTHWVCILMRATVINIDQVAIQEVEKFDKWQWVAPDALPSPLHTQFLKLFDCYTLWRNRK